MRAEEEARKEQEILYEFVNVNKGLSIYEISKRLQWDVIETYNILKGLEKEGLIRIKASEKDEDELNRSCLLYTSPSPRDRTRSRMPSSA